MSTSIQEINVQTNGLGMVIKVNTPPPGNSSTKYSYYRKVYFCPDDGSYIKNIKLTYTRTSNSSGNNVTSEPTETYSRFDPLTRNVEDMNIYGCHSLGIEYSATGPDIAGISTYSKTTNTYEIMGTAHQLSLSVVGGGDTDTRIFFQYGYYLSSDQSGEPNGIQTLICRTTPSAQTYTNLVGYHGNDVVFTSGLYDSISVTDNCFHPTNSTSLPQTSYETNFLPIIVYTEFPISQFVLYSNCRLCVFALNTRPCEEISPQDSYSNFKHEVRSMFWSAARKLRDINNEEDLRNIFCGYLDIPNGCLTTMVGTEKKYLYPDIKVYNSIRESNYSNDPRLATMVGANSGTITGDLLWTEHLKEGSRNISRYTHVVRLVHSSETQKISGIADAESNYARFTGYWFIYGQYWNKDKKSTYGKFMYGHRDGNVPTDGGNLVFNPVFKPWAECDLVIFQENDVAFPRRYLNFFQERLDGIYKIGNQDFRKSWYVDARSEAVDVRKKLKYFSKTVSPYKNMILECHGSRDEYWPDNEDYEGRGYICISKDRSISPEMLQTAIRKCKYWWSDDDWQHKLCFGLFSNACYSHGFQDEATRAPLGNCIVKDSKKIVPDLDDMFYALGATATHHNWGSQLVQLELPAMEIAAKGNATYSDYCEKFNNIVQNLKTDVFRLITKFYVNYFDDMVKCLKTEEDEEMWNRTYEIILDDLKSCGRRYFCYPYRDPDDWRRNSPDTRIHLNGEGDGEVEERDYYAHDGFVGLIRREIFDEDTPNPVRGFLGNTKKYFIELTDEDVLGHMAYAETLERINRGLSKLETAVEAKVRLKLGLGYPSWIKSIAITEPHCGCSGIYRTTNARFMANPNKDYDDWLTDDTELANLVELTGDFIYYGLD